LGGPVGAEPGGGLLGAEPGAGPVEPSGAPVFAGGGCPPPSPPRAGAGPPALGAEPPALGAEPPALGAEPLWAPGPWAGDESYDPPGLLGASFGEPPPEPLEPSSNPPPNPPPLELLPPPLEPPLDEDPPPLELLPLLLLLPPPPAVSNDDENPGSTGVNGLGSAPATPAPGPKRVKPRQPATATHAANCCGRNPRFPAEAVVLGCRRCSMFATLSALSATRLGRRCGTRIDVFGDVDRASVLAE
jgi:hypothetical protein